MVLTQRNTLLEGREGDASGWATKYEYISFLERSQGPLQFVN